MALGYIQVVLLYKNDVRSNVFMLMLLYMLLLLMSLMLSMLLIGEGLPSFRKYSIRGTG